MLSFTGPPSSASICSRVMPFLAALRCLSVAGEECKARAALAAFVVVGGGGRAALAALPVPAGRHPSRRITSSNLHSHRGLRRTGNVFLLLGKPLLRLLVPQRLLNERICVSHDEILLECKCRGPKACRVGHEDVRVAETAACSLDRRSVQRSAQGRCGESKGSSTISEQLSRAQQVGNSFLWAAPGLRFRSSGFENQ